MLLPDPDLVSAMNAEVEGRLAVALDHLIVEVIKRPSMGPSAYRGPAAHALQALMREAALADDVDAIHGLYRAHRDVLTGSDHEAACRVVAWDSGDLRPSEMALLREAFRDDIGLTGSLVAPDPEAVDLVRANFARLRVGLAAATPLWWAELEALVRMIVLASPNDPSRNFGGASAFAAWGAILVNPDFGRSPKDLAFTLIHESSHLKLFHAYLDDEVVLNDPGELYASPLRREARPMNGIFHAVYVLARMASFAADLLESGQANAVFGDEAEAALRDEMGRNVRAFEAAHEIVAAHGKLSAKGTEILASAATGVAATGALRR